MLTWGSAIYPHRPDLASKRYWRCVQCANSYVGCHQGGDGEDALGRPAGPETRRARNLLHGLLDPLWRDAPDFDGYGGQGKRYHIRQKARVRVYAWLQYRLGIPAAECHISHFDLTRCRLAWRALNGQAYGNIRRWYKDEGGETEVERLG